MTPDLERAIRLKARRVRGQRYYLSSHTMEVQRYMAGAQALMNTLRNNPKLNPLWEFVAMAKCDYHESQSGFFISKTHSDRCRKCAAKKRLGIE